MYKRQVARHGFNEKYDDVEVKIQTLSEEPETRETQIQKLRTQIVAGKGYDVYILNNLRYGSGEPLDELPLFDNPYKTMQSGVFSPLNDNMNQDSYWNGTSYFDPLLKAGQYEGKQYIQMCIRDRHNRTGVRTNPPEEISEPWTSIPYIS